MRSAVAALLLLTIFLAGCGSNSTSSPQSTQTSQQPVAISLQAPASPIRSGSTVAFIATVSNSSNQAVSWQVNGRPGGDASCGTISQYGIYEPPRSLAAPMQITVTATAMADPSKSATATVMVHPLITASIEPAITSMPAGTTQKLAVRLSNGETADGAWSVLGTGASITEDGTLTAPLAVGWVHVQVFTKGEHSYLASATIKVVPSNQLLNGRYIFAYDGTRAGEHVAMAGAFTADGEGRISGGVFDAVSPAQVNNDVAFSGTYEIGPTGLGTMTLAVGGTTRTWELGVVGRGSALFAELSGPTVGSGVLERQDLRSTPGTMPSGRYFVSSSPAPRGPALAGMFDSDGAGKIVSGEYDLRRSAYPAVHNTFTGAYSIDTSGRGTLNLADAQGSGAYRVYQVSPARVYAISLDSSNDSLLVAEGPSDDCPQCRDSLGNAIFESLYALQVAGTGPAGPLVISAGEIALHDGKIDSGDIDEIRGNSAQHLGAIGGSYTSTSGRFEMQIVTAVGVRNFIVYGGGRNSAVVLAEDGAQAAGSIQPQGFFFFVPSCTDFPFLSAVAPSPAGSILLGQALVGSENQSSVSVRENGTATLHQPVSTAMEATFPEMRKLLRIGGPVTRTYAVHHCGLISLDGNVPEFGTLKAADTILWDIIIVGPYSLPPMMD